MLSNSAKKEHFLYSNEIVYRVSELNYKVKNLLEDHFSPLWIEGEISNFVCPSSGHWYFSLKDKQAQVRCVLFKAYQQYKDDTLKDGLQILVRAKISLYPARGEFQLIVDYFERAGEGALRIAFEKLKLQLSAEGLFDAAHKKALPKFPKTIGIITSETGAALHDICSILKQRFSMIAIIIYPCLMQGKLAARQIAQQIQCANKRKECELLILARGGGSLEDLWPFNEEGVARAIFNSHLPIISAIGHETDFTIADFVADHRAATPSMAAQLASPDKLEYLRLLNKTTQRLTQAIRYQLVHYHHLLKNLATRLRDPRQYLQDTIQRLDNLIQRLNLALKTQLHIRQEKLVGFSRTLHAISPLASLERGYALITLENTEQIVSHTHQVKVGDTIIATLSKGKLACRVEKKLAIE